MAAYDFEVYDSDIEDMIITFRNKNNGKKCAIATDLVQGYGLCVSIVATKS